MRDQRRVRHATAVYGVIELTEDASGIGTIARIHREGSRISPPWGRVYIKLRIGQEDVKLDTRDPAGASEATRLADKLALWIQAGALQGTLQSGCEELCEACIRSRYINTLILAARCTGIVAEVRGVDDTWIHGVFRRAHARARCMLLRFAEPQSRVEGAAYDQLVLLGLSDRSSRVRSFATEQAFRWHLEHLKSAMSREPNAGVREYMEGIVSIIPTGYVLHSDVQHGERMLEYRTKLCSGAFPIPVEEFRLGVEEHEVIDRYLAKRQIKLD